MKFRPAVLRLLLPIVWLVTLLAGPAHEFAHAHGAAGAGMPARSQLQPPQEAPADPAAETLDAGCLLCAALAQPCLLDPAVTVPPLPQACGRVLPPLALQPLVPQPLRWRFSSRDPPAALT